MSHELYLPESDRRTPGQAQQAVRFFATAVAALCVSGVILALLARLLGRPEWSGEVWFPPAFAVSTLLLVVGSIALQRAVRFVRREKQRPFRRWLLAGLACGTLFIGVQSYGLWTLLPAQRAAAEASLGVTPFVLMLAGLHALHLSVALLFLSFVVVRALADRYDHEYFWGVRCCAWFWHALGIAWLFILAIFAIAL